MLRTTSLEVLLANVAKGSMLAVGKSAPFRFSDVRGEHGFNEKPASASTLAGTAPQLPMLETYGPGRPIDRTT